MKLIALLIITATLNVTLLNKNNNLINFDTSTMELEINSNFLVESRPTKAKYIDLVKQKLLTHLKKCGKHIIKILIQTNIITIKDNKPSENITLKQETLESNRKQQI